MTNDRGDGRSASGNCVPVSTTIGSRPRMSSGNEQDLRKVLRHR